MAQVFETGIMLYCFRYNEGCLILGNKIPNNINKRNEWEDVGTFKIDSYGVVTLSPSDPDWMNYISGDWKNSDFLHSIYDENMNSVILPKKNGMVLKCFENNKTLFLLSHRLPVKGLQELGGQWEDIGTFHMSENKIVYHDDDHEDQPNGDIYDGNLKKINIPSY